MPTLLFEMILRELWGAFMFSELDVDADKLCEYPPAIMTASGR